MKTQRTPNERLYPPSPQSTNSTQLLPALADSARLNKSGSARPAQQPTNPNHLTATKIQGVEGGELFVVVGGAGVVVLEGCCARLVIKPAHLRTRSGFGPPEPPSGITPARPFAARPFGSPGRPTMRPIDLYDFSLFESIGCVPSPQVSSFDSMATE